LISACEKGKQTFAITTHVIALVISALEKFGNFRSNAEVLILATPL
jgi:hypothetical protein